MSVVPGFEYDLFISYAPADDKPSGLWLKPWGWVTEFVQTLEAELLRKSPDFKICWNPNLQAGDLFDTATGVKISQSAVFLCVLSTAYGKSIYCQKEVEAFRLRRPSFNRMQCIVIDPEITRDQWPRDLWQFDPPKFFNRHSRRLIPPLTPAPTDPWFQSIWETRDSIWSELSALRHPTEPGAGSVAPYKPGAWLEARKQKKEVVKVLKTAPLPTPLPAKESRPVLPFEAYAGSKPYIFVSYSHHDRAVVFPDITALYNQGFRIWYDEGIASGSRWRDFIAEKLEGSAAFLLFLSSRAVASANVVDEIDYALDHREKPFIAVHIEETRLEKGLRLSLSGIQGILRWQMSNDYYQRKLLAAFPPAVKK